MNPNAFGLLTAAVALVLGLGVSGGSSLAAADYDPDIAKILTSISEARLERLLTTLVGFGTRNTLSTSESPERGMPAARQWIHDEMARSSPRLQVSFDTYHVAQQGERLTRDVELRNVVAVLPGRSPRRIYVSGHFDSLARIPPVDGSDASVPPGLAAGTFDWQNTNNVAPGANDDGSGTVLTMELARAFAESGLEFDATLVFVAFAGEEQGLVGSKLHAQRAEAEGTPIDAVFNNDIVGNDVGGNGLVDSESVRVFSEGPEDSPSRQLARYIRRYASRYVPSHTVRLIARHDRFGRGGDHTSFNQHGFAAVRITESNENYRRQHSVHDTIDGVSFPYLARNARVNAAGVAALALAPPAPRVVDERGAPRLERGPSGYDAHLRWSASPGAVGYRVFWRRAWTPDWEHEMGIGHLTEVVLPNVSVDDYIFGVAAVGPDGHESLVSAYVNPPRREVEIKTLSSSSPR